MNTFSYKPRSLRDVAVRAIQTATETDKSPPAEPTDCCRKCFHPKWAHCSIRRSRETREVLFYARHRGGYLWVRAGAYSAGLHGYSLAVCKHFRPDQADWPCCGTSSCAAASCDCASFISPYRKPRVSTPKKATGTTGTRKKRKKIAGEQTELFDGV
jgi:hypothetical protein